MKKNITRVSLVSMTLFVLALISLDPASEAKGESEDIDSGLASMDASVLEQMPLSAFIAEVLLTGEMALLNNRLKTWTPEEDPKNASEALMLAAVDGDVDLLSKLVEAGIPIDSPDEDGWTPLMMAVLVSQINNAMFLVAHGADPHLEVRTRLSAVNIALSQGEREFLENIGYEFEASGLEAELHEAVRRQDHELIERLLAQGVDIDWTDMSGYTALMYAARSNDTGSLKLLLDASSDPDGVSADGSTALLLAIRSGHIQTLNILLDGGANADGPDQAVMPPLAAAVLSGDEDIAIRLLDAGASTRFWDRSRQSLDLEQLASESGMTKVASRLNGLSLRDDPVRAFAKALNEGDAENLRWLISEGLLDPNLRLDESGLTPMMAIINRQPYIHELLSAIVGNARRPQVDLNVRDSSGMNALHYAARSNNYAAINYIMSQRVPNRYRHGIELARDNMGRTALMQAILNENIDAINTLAYRDRRMHTIPDNEDIQPLVAAVMSGNTNMMLMRC
jgi:ankyrin repeat protein